MDNLPKSQSFYNPAHVPVSKPLMNPSKSFSFGCNIGDSFKNMAEFKSSIDGNQVSIKEEETCTC